MEETTEQKAFCEAIAQNTKGIDDLSTGWSAICPECYEPYGLCCEHAAKAHQEEHPDIGSEGHFSWHRCDCCGSTFGGDRHPAHGWMENHQELVHLEVCVDCLMFIANGDSPEKWTQHPK